MISYIEFDDEQDSPILNTHGIKKDGCMANLLVSILASERAQCQTVTVMSKDVRSFRDYQGFRINSLFIDVIYADLNDLSHKKLFILVNKNQKPICVNSSTKKIMGVKLTGLGRWMAFALSWNLSLFAMCVAAEINLHNCSTNAKNMTICDGFCTCHGMQRTGMHERRLMMVNPFTMIKFAHRFPYVKRCKITRTLKELDSAGMISVSKTMHCNVIRSNLDHPLFSKYSLILSRLTKAMHGEDTLENTSRSIRHVRFVPHISKELKI